jgi:LmbE family N-acetylglucosaminyl deacetylase
MMDVDRPPVDHAKIARNLAAHVQGSGDPCVTAGSLSWPPPSNAANASSSSPPELRVYWEVTEQLEAYDRHAKQTREYYFDALERQKQAGGSFGTGALDPRRKNSIAF